MPLPPPIDAPDLARRVGSYSERVDAEHARFVAAWRRTRRRFAVCAVLGAALVAGFGAWAFRIETNTRRAPVPPRGSPVMVVIGARR